MAVAVKRYKTSRGGRLALELFKYEAGNSQIEHLLLFHTIGPSDDRWLIRDRVPALTNNPKGIAIGCNIRGFEIRFGENLDSGKDGPVFV